uniref:mucin-binding protein n=1 Tax=Streptococcus mitis TaxID=28037 RepID=UPI003B21B1B6
KTITRTIKYVDATDETTEVARPVTQRVELTRTNKRNKVTNVVTEGTWSTGTWGSQTSPTVTNYDAPDKATVAEATVTSTTDDTTVVVKYPQATEDVTETKTITRTIKYVDATDETTEVARPVTQRVELTRTNKRNKVTNVVTEGTWSTGTWGSQTSPTVTNYDAPDKATVAEATVTSTTD